MSARRPGRTALLALLGALVVAGCDAPLEPESRRASAGSTEGVVTPSEPAASELATPPPSTDPTGPAVPDVTVPESLRTGAPALPRDRVIVGADASWPQCPQGMGIPEKRSQGAPMPLPKARYVILGLTNGPGFTPNPCLAEQTEWVRSRGLMAAAYAVTSWPDAATLEEVGDDGPFDGGTRLGALSNVGFQQARYNLATMKEAGLRSPVIWIDVEPVPVFEWSQDPVANAAVVKGAARGYTDAGFRIGVYSTQTLWETVVGDLELGLPEWRAAGQTSRAEALRRCGPERMYQGGDAVLSQWVEAGRDQNVTCPGTSLEMGRWFHQY